MTKLLVWDQMVSAANDFPNFFSIHISQIVSINLFYFAGRFFVRLTYVLLSLVSQLFIVETSGVDLEFLLAKAAMEILYGHPDYTLPKPKFLSLYRQKLQELESVGPERKLLDCLPCCIVVSVSILFNK